ncbi:hypothetical protein [Shimia marina]|uniref:ATPases of the AAA+ class n=1 Tax=Shimia marina TaxID=321267 RepID=A0A0P1FEN3_9RHOB|nr:hypothetical protein [Shimia marina]CUH52822.1 hypothetical protein SHM7688_02269 [Shimia marina]SFD88370.1 hypothetical protein SAMN04488037_10373 [Shimia marina]
MRHLRILALVAAVAMPVTVATAQESAEGRSLMEEGMRLFFEGLQEEMAPTLEGLQGLMLEIGPELQSFMAEMGPKLGAVMSKVDDWSQYQAPEILPNGDIIIRKKPEERAPEAPQQGPQDSHTDSDTPGVEL